MLIDIIQMPRELFVPFDLGGFVVPRVLTKSQWVAQANPFAPPKCSSSIMW